MNMSFHIFVAGEFFDCEQVEVMNVLRVTHGQNRGVKPNVVSAMQLIDHTFVLG